MSKQTLIACQNQYLGCMSKSNLNCLLRQILSQNNVDSTITIFFLLHWTKIAHLLKGLQMALATKRNIKLWSNIKFTVNDNVHGSCSSFSRFNILSDLEQVLLAKICTFLHVHLDLCLVQSNKGTFSAAESYDLEIKSLSELTILLWVLLSNLWKLYVYKWPNGRMYWVLSLLQHKYLTYNNNKNWCK